MTLSEPPSASMPAAFATQVEALRQASPYINAFRGGVLVIHFDAAMLDDGRASALIHDIALLCHLGLKIVLVMGTRTLVERALQQSGRRSVFHLGNRVTPADDMPLLLEVVGSARSRLEATLSVGLANTPMSGAKLTVVSGNLISARPFGIHEGVDFERTGSVRRVDVSAMRGLLDAGHIVLLGPIAHSPTGESFNLRSDELASETAAALNAEKLIYLLPLPARAALPARQLTPAQAEQWVPHTPGEETDIAARLRLGANAVRRCVRRVHLVDEAIDGALLIELFSRDGCGIMISVDNYDGLRPAQLEDIPGLLELIHPLVADGTLAPRAKAHLESDIDQFWVVERDGMIAACAALIFHDAQHAEIACLVTHPAYRGSGRAAALVEHLQAQAQQRGAEQIFVLTTRTAHWFVEKGFVQVGPEHLPVTKRHAYDTRRNSKVFMHRLA